MDTRVYLWEELPCGLSIQGPAIIIDKNRQVFPLPVFHSSRESCELTVDLPSISTILVEPSCEAHLTDGGDVCMTVGSDPACAVGTELNAVQLSIFSHRFMSIAGTERRRGWRRGDLEQNAETCCSSSTEQMGRVLQRTSISTNIKERLDFSCAVFGPDGGLVSNAPHIPVHLGAMQETVQYQVRDV